MSIMYLALQLSFSDKLRIPVGNGQYKEIGEDSGEYDYYESSFTLIDANNDGHLDIEEFCPLYSGSMGSAYVLYIYNPKEQKFEEGKDFLDLSVNGDGTISSMSKSGYSYTEVVNTGYKWDGQDFKMVYSDYNFDCDSIRYGKYEVYDFNSQEQEVLSVKYYKTTDIKFDESAVEVSKEEYENIKNKFNY